MWVVKATPRRLYPEKDPISIVQEAGWTPELVWMGPEDLATPGFGPRIVYRKKLKLCCFST
jgi:hypothetical protein